MNQPEAVVDTSEKPTKMAIGGKGGFDVLEKKREV